MSVVIVRRAAGPNVFRPFVLNRVSIVSPDVLFLPENFYSLDLLVVPLWGLYANMIAQLISQVSSHFIIHYHRKIVKEAKVQHKEQNRLAAVASPSIPTIQNKGTNSRVNVDVSPGGNDSLVEETPSQRISLRKHRFGRPHRGETEKLIVRSWVDKLLFVGTLLLIVAVIIGCSVPSFSLEILGIIGVAVESGQDFQDATTQHSVFTVIKLLFEEAQFLGTVADYLGLGTLSVLFVFTVLLVPVIQSLALLRQWFKPATREQTERMSVVLEILQAWQYAEVYLIAIFVASWQLGPVSEFMINSYCDSLKETFGKLVYYGLLKEEDAQCFSVKSSIESGSFFLAFGAVLLALLSTFVTKAVVQYLRDEGETEKRLRDEEDSLYGSEFTSGTDEDSELDGALGSRIHPAPVLFTDTFRWLLFQENNNWQLPDAHYHWGSPASSSSRAMFLPEARVLSQEPIDSTPDKYPMMNYSAAKAEPDVASVSKRSLSSASADSFNGFHPKRTLTAGLKTTGLPQRESFSSDCAPSRASFVDSNSYTSENQFRDEASVSSRSFSRSLTGTTARSSENQFRDEASVSSRSFSRSFTGTTGRSMGPPSEYETVGEEYEYVEDDIPGDSATEYEEQTVDTGYDEQTVGTGYEEQTVDTGYDEQTVGTGYEERTVGTGYEDRTVGTGYEEYTVVTADDIIEEELDDVVSSYESRNLRRLD
eukprot:scaffold4056_cov115-Cylindrotheca_fusiformis.AAC.9